MVERLEAGVRSGMVVVEERDAERRRASDVPFFNMPVRIGLTWLTSSASRESASARRGSPVRHSPRTEFLSSTAGSQDHMFEEM